MHRIDSRIDEIRAANSLQGAAVSQPPLALKKAPLLELTSDDMQNSLRSLRRTFLDTWPQTAALSPGLFFVFVQLCLDGGFDLFVQGAVVLEDFLCRVAALRQLGAFVTQPGTTLLDDLFFQCKIEESASGGNSLVIHDIELGFGERRSNFVFHDFDARPISRYNAVGLFDGADAADIDSHAGVKLQRPAAGSHLRVSKHDSDLFSNLVCENAACRALEMIDVSLRNAALISRACAPTVASPISPSSSALVTSAATESTTITSRALERTRVSQIRSASSPELG